MIGKWHIGFHKIENLPWNCGFDTFSDFSTLTQTITTVLFAAWDLLVDLTSTRNEAQIDLQLANMGCIYTFPKQKKLLILTNQKRLCFFSLFYNRCIHPCKYQNIIRSFIFIWFAPTDRSRLAWLPRWMRPWKIWRSISKKRQWGMASCLYFSQIMEANL